MQRLMPEFRLKVDRVDALLACSLAIVAWAYALGYRLDWSQADLKPEEPLERSLAAVLPVQPPEAVSLPQANWASESNWEAMTEELSLLAAKHQGRVAIYLRDLGTGKTWTYHEEDLFPSASLIKVPLMACVFYKIRDGQLSLYDKLTLRRRHRRGGSGSLKWRPDGTRLTIRELLQHMISESDNTATAMVLEALGLNYVQQQFPKLGLVYTGISEEGMSLKGGRVAQENYTTAREMAMMLEKIYRGELVDRPSSQLMMEILKHKKAVTSRLAKGLPGGWEIAHKTGLLRQACHDSAIILTPHGDYAITVLTGQNASYRTAKDFINRLGKITFAHYEGSANNYYAKAADKRPGQIVLR